MEELKQEIIDKQKEANYYYWQTLITVNALLATLLIAVLAFKKFTSEVRLFIILGLVVTLSSCVTLLINFINVKEVYEKIADLIHSGEVPDAKAKKEHIDYALKRFKENKRNEKIAFISTITAWVIILGLIFFFI